MNPFRARPPQRPDRLGRFRRRLRPGIFFEGKHLGFSRLKMHLK